MSEAVDGKHLGKLVKTLNNAEIVILFFYTVQHTFSFVIYTHLQSDFHLFIIKKSLLFNNYIIGVVSTAVIYVA